VKTGLLRVRTFIIPTPILQETILFLRGVGMKGREGFVLWGGKTVDPETFRFQTALIPAQRASATQNGLLVTVDGEALFEVNKTLHERGEILGAQVHSHPTDAYHSSTDDHFPLATLLGALSVVIPNFAREAPKDLDDWAWYRLTAYDRWEPPTSDTTIEIE
jgi:proteasome lid subunit RPN8/RPN11